MSSPISIVIGYLQQPLQLLTNSPADQDWADLNMRIRTDADEDDKDGHVCTKQCFRDARRVLRQLLYGNMIIVLEGGESVRTQDHVDCLHKRLRRICTDDIDLAETCKNLYISVNMINTIVNFSSR